MSATVGRRMSATVGRRTVITMGALALAAATMRVGHAQTHRLVKIGALTDSWGPTNGIVGFRDGLQQLGYRENQDFVLGVRFTQGNAGELPAAARELVRHGVDLMIVVGGAAAAAAHGATSQVPIVFAGGPDPVGAGLVKSFARPGGNVTGVADLEVELLAKRMDLLRELLPGLRRMLVVYDATNADAVAKLEAHWDAARRLGLTLVEKPAHTEEEARAAIAAARKADVDLMFAPRSLSLNIPGLILELAPRASIPTMFQDAFFVERGGLISYAANTYEVGRQAARLAAKILKGARPAEIPVEQPTKFDLVINMKTAKALGLTVPPTLLLRADQAIQ
jgi:putative tryptophan/tyrosine transport system substrate-binding protein